VRLTYFTAGSDGPGAASGGDARLLAHPTGSEATHSSSQQSKVLVWDQAALGAVPSSPFVFSPTNPVLSVLGASQRAPPTRLLPLGGSSLAIVALELPAAAEWGPDLAAAKPPGSFWFLEVVLDHTDSAGQPQATTLSVAYDWASGALTAHKVYWQRRAELVGQPGEGLERVVLKSVAPPAERCALQAVQWGWIRAVKAGRSWQGEA